MQLYGGPLDGLEFDQPNGDQFESHIGRKQVTLADGTTIPVWIMSNNYPEGRATYRRDKSGKFKHVVTVPAK